MKQNIELKELKTYLVGGAVRDKLLNRESKDRDYVVVGSTIEEMEKLGFEKVGADFPVFLHPITKEEYALARTEIKTGKGYNGFTTFFSKETTLEEDLARRDLTINAIAYDEKNNVYIDPYKGMEDLKNKVLRHTTEAFKEDPLRVLRLARFYARYKDFSIAKETKDFCHSLLEELNDLTPERVWKEIEKVFTEEKPSRFFYFLEEIGALKIIMPELANLKDVPQTAICHPEICSFVHTMMVLDRASELCLNNEKYNKEEKTAILFAALTHDLGKGITPKELLPKHLNHEINGVPLIKDVCDRLKVPNLVKHLSLLVGEQHLKVHNSMELNPKTIVRLFKEWDYNRRPKMVEMLALVCQADSQGRLTFEKRPYPQREYLMRIFEEIKQTNLSSVIEKYKDNKVLLIDNIYKKRLDVAKKIKPELITSLSIDYDLEKMMKFNQNIKKEKIN